MSRPGLTPGLAVATISGLLHATASAIWATGSDFLVETVGEVAGRLESMGPTRMAIALGSISLVKLVATAVPVIGAYGRLRPRAIPWRRLQAAGGSLLVLYGGVSMVLSGIGVVVESSSVVPDAAALTSLWGHLLLWDLLFTSWGAGLLVHLAKTRG